MYIIVVVDMLRICLILCMLRVWQFQDCMLRVLTLTQLSFPCLRMSGFNRPVLTRFFVEQACPRISDQSFAAGVQVHINTNSLALR